MSVPYGQPEPAQRPGSANSLDGQGLGNVFALAAGGLGLVSYFVSFSDDAGAYLRTGLVGILLLGGGLLAASAVLPKAPATLVPASVLVVTATLFLLLDVVKNPVLFGRVSGGSTPALAVLALLLAIMESTTCVVALLAAIGVVKMTPRPRPVQQPWGAQQSWAAWGAQQPWGSQQPGGYPQPPPGGYPGQPPGGPPSGTFSAQPPPQYGAPQHGQATQHFGEPGPAPGESYGGQSWHPEQPGHPEQAGHPEQPGPPPGGYGRPSQD